MGTIRYEKFAAVCTGVMRRVDQQTGLHRLLRALWCAHLYHNFIGFNARVPHGVLTMHRTSSTGSIVEENVIKGSPHNIVGESWLKGVDLECKSVSTTSLIL